MLTLLHLEEDGREINLEWKTPRLLVVTFPARGEIEHAVSKTRGIVIECVPSEGGCLRTSPFSKKFLKNYSCIGIFPYSHGCELATSRILIAQGSPQEEAVEIGNS